MQTHVLQGLRWVLAVVSLRSLRLRYRLASERRRTRTCIVSLLAAPVIPAMSLTLVTGSPLPQRWNAGCQFLNITRQRGAGQESNLDFDKWRGGGGRGT